MQTSNVQLSLAVKSGTSVSATGEGSGLLGQKGSSGGFASWMQEASNRPAQFDRSNSNSLPQDGSALPPGDASEARSQVEPTQEPKSDPKQDSDDPSVAQDGQGGVSTEANTVEADESVGKTESGVSAADQSDADPSQSSGDENSSPQMGVSTESSPEDGPEQITPTVNVATTPAADELEVQVAAETQSDVSSEPDVAKTPSGSVIREGGAGSGEPTNAAQASDLEASLSAADIEGTPTIPQSGGQVAADGGENLEGQAAADEVAVPASDQSGQRVGSQVKGYEGRLPPGAEHASEQGIANGKPFESLRAETGAESGSAVSEHAVEPDTLVAVNETSVSDAESFLQDDSVNPQISPESIVQSETAPSADTEVVQEFADPDSGSQQVDSDLVQTSARSDSSEEAQSSEVESSVDVESELVANDTAPVDVSREEPTRSDEPQVVAASSASSVANAERSDSRVSQPVTSPQGQQVGAESQAPRQPGLEPVAQLKTANTPVDDAAKTALSEAQASPAKTTAAAAPVGDAGGKLNTAVTQQSLPTAVPPQALNRMHQASWGQKLGERSLMMVQHGPRVAYVQLDPPELGSLQVRVHLHQGDQVSLNITAPNAAVKDVLEQHLPRLREMFAEQGLNLAQSDVRDQSAEGRERQGSQDGSSRGQYAGLNEDEEPVFMEMDVPVGMVDYYA